jgi:hypothetical protein
MAKIKHIKRLYIQILVPIVDERVEREAAKLPCSEGASKPTSSETSGTGVSGTSPLSASQPPMDSHICLLTEIFNFLRVLRQLLNHFHIDLRPRFPLHRPSLPSVNYRTQQKLP